MNNYTVISFYTDRPTTSKDTDTSTYYSDHAKRLKIELSNNSLNYDIRELPSKNNYMQNCLLKPKFILNLLEEKKLPVLWMDIDCIIKDFPYDFADCEYDMCIVKRSDDISESCFIYFNYTPGSLKFINEWKERCESAITNLDHLIMIELYNKYKYTLKIKEYPWYYANPQNFNEVKILMISSKFADKRDTELIINKQGTK